MKKFIFLFSVSTLFLGFVIGISDDNDEELETIEYSGDINEVQPLSSAYHVIEDENPHQTKRNDSTISTNDILFVETPQFLQSQILRRKAYTVSYNKETRCPNWVAWHLTAEHADGSLKRHNSFREDEDVPRPRATLDDYKRSGWSRGHMCPAGDNKWDELAMEESFLLTNVCPQDERLNSGVWNRIEMDCRQWARKYGEVFIVCGPVLLKREHETIGKNRVVVPEAFFKVVLCMKDKPKAIGFVIRNNEGKKKRDMFVNSVDEVERITGYDFFPALPDEVENVIEAKADIKEW
ncbi:MAG: DNA/RNA non-specific endonuclease [Aeriscardovia sp.]|nr:DNA/RNA non-specific endonuclease [Aeriscardovia sp.]MBP3842924.1 DNA/RNA non-specific endonuclease [Prevotella sp.]